MMKYKIKEKIEYRLEQNLRTKLYETKVIKKYYIKRKGRIFGFWHDVGDWLWSSGGSWISLKFFDTREEAISYLSGWNLREYGEREKLEIIDVRRIKNKRSRN